MASGTPWEDRGSEGVLKAFFATCILSLASPRQLLTGISRADSAYEATWFAAGCGMMWSAWALIRAVIEWAGYVLHPDRYEYDPVLYWSRYGILIVLLPLLAVGLVHLAGRIYHAMVSGILRGGTPRGTITTVIAYCLGPSLLAPIPYVGPWLAGLWILALLLMAGSVALELEPRDAVTCGLISYLAAAAIGIALVAGGAWLSRNMGGETVIEKPQKQIRQL